MGVNLNYIDDYAVLERANDRKLHVFAMKHEGNTYSEHSITDLIHYHDDVLKLSAIGHPKGGRGLTSSTEVVWMFYWKMEITGSVFVSVLGNRMISVECSLNKTCTSEFFKKHQTSTSLKDETVLFECLHTQVLTTLSCNVGNHNFSIPLQGVLCVCNIFCKLQLSWLKIAFKRQSATVWHQILSHNCSILFAIKLQRIVRLFCSQKEAIQLSLVILS